MNVNVNVTLHVKIKYKNFKDTNQLEISVVTPLINVNIAKALKHIN